MKPNILIVQPAHLEFDAAVDIFCESLSETHYVYLVRPGSAFRDDSPAGVRFLNHSIDRLPGFADVDTVIAIGEPGIADQLKKAYPASTHTAWDPTYDNDFLESFLASTKVVQGEFGNEAAERLNRAM